MCWNGLRLRDWILMDHASVGIYLSWLRNPRSWGGVLELSLFAHFAERRVYVYEAHGGAGSVSASCREYRSFLEINPHAFGDGDADRGVHVSYSGSHYDVLELGASSLSYFCDGRCQRLRPAKEFPKRARATVSRGVSSAGQNRHM